MRGDTDPAARHAHELTSPARHALAAGTLLLLILSLLTGASASAFILPLAVGLVLLVRYINNNLVVWFAPIAAAGALALTDIASGVGLARALTGGLLLAAAALPGWWWRREALAATAQLSQLDDILAQARRGRSAEAPDAAEELADLELALRTIAERMQARTVMLWDVDRLHDTARVRSTSHGRPPRELRLHGDPLGWVWEQGMRLRLDPRPRWADPGTIVVADLLRRRDDVGCLVTYAFDPARFDVENTLFDDAAVALRNTLARQEARSIAAAQVRRVRALVDGLKLIPGELAIDAFAAELCATAAAATDATGAALGLWSAEEGAGRIIAVSGDDGGPQPGDTFEPPGSELALAVRAGEMIVRSTTSWSLGSTAVSHRGERWRRTPRALATLPLRSGNGVIGVLAVWSTTQPSLEVEALDLLNALAPYAALHIEHSLQYGALHDTADRDPLTQLRNRRGFDRMFDDATARHARHARPLSLLVLDLDHFKSVNDRYGHEAGDVVLTRVARLIEAGIRDVDTAARFGGEEFVVLLPETGLKAALDVAERIRTAVADAYIEWHGTMIPVRVSIGVSCCPDRVTAPSELLGSADAALYRAKAEGRNRVVVAGK
jgi:diguanylate cyclase (GGDEF)-like protein